MSLLRFCLSADPLIRLSVQYICQHKKGSLAAVLRAVYALSLIYASDRSLCPISDLRLWPQSMPSDLRLWQRSMPYLWSTPLIRQQTNDHKQNRKSASLLSASQRSSCLQNVQEDTFCVSLDLLNTWIKLVVSTTNLQLMRFWTHNPTGGGGGGGESFDCF